jgi:hypothetical protein
VEDATLVRDYFEKRKLIETYGERIKHFAWSHPGLDRDGCGEIDRAADRVKELTQEILDLLNARRM